MLKGQPNVLRKLNAQRRNFGLGPLTVRQTEITKMIAEGKGTKYIASALKLSVKTVDTHRTVIYARLGLRAGDTGMGSAVLLTRWYLRNSGEKP